MIRVTEELLAEFGACGDYLRKFKRHFPLSDERYEDGVEVTGDVVREYQGEYDWNWAASRWFTPATHERFSNTQYGYDDASRAIQEERRQFDDDFRQQQREWRRKYNEDEWSSGSTPEARAEYRAAQSAYQEKIRTFDERTRAVWTDLFAELLNDEQYHSPALKQALVNAEERRARNDEARLKRAEEKIVSLRNEIDHWTNNSEAELAQAIARLEERREQLAREIEEQRTYWVEEPPKRIAELTEKITEAEDKLTGLRTRVAGRRLRQAEAAVQRAQAAVETAQREAAEQLERLETARREAAQRLEEARDASAESVEPVTTAVAVG